MKKNNKSENYSGPHFILNYDRLEPGDIILERGYSQHSELISKQTNSDYSHAMICVGGTIIEATREGGVFSRIPNRSTVRDINDFKVLRLKEYPGDEVIKVLCNHARCLAGSQYSVVEALKVKAPDFLREFEKDSRKQFCSRLVAQSYNKAKINLVDNINFCSPGDLERSRLLHVVEDMVHLASEEEIAHALTPSPHVIHMKCAVGFVRAALKIFESHGIRTIENQDDEVVITTINDITTALYQNRSYLGLDEELTDAMLSSGYLDHIDTDRRQNQYRYDPVLFRQKMEQEAGKDEELLLDILRDEIRKDWSVLEVRLQSYFAGRDNLKSGLKYAEAEFTIPKGLLKGMLERIIVIRDYISTKESTPDLRKMNDACNEIIQKISHVAPELLKS
ncbi:MULTISPECIES: YiiX/YebB-like N1pC/P60 family cysteine hydrolase [Pectobacterium]|uniref:Uncharacterized protein n=1 Tax=Pectobacterium aquaticum TaxID=2204145 RepID=A0AA93AN86_9GAMM|nr:MULTISPECIES: YiiX/YebB-like N1pC/P60 family cysteine hydrolase [Pectobacterium]MBE5221354.1 hypothetical protein [Pectobacterium quasiaquaticum]RRN95065.1 hypothetical protein DMB79_014500 [Pectobacterium aquaticum]RRO08317.1 hypothetical protein DMB85_011365 [Pectobacterium aquaticum]RRO22435.1 hypothetical protein DMB84_005995 [Pectobacterium aquaticum]